MIVTEDQIREEITDAIRRNRVMLFMKGQVPEYTLIRHHKRC